MKNMALLLFLLAPLLSFADDLNPPLAAYGESRQVRVTMNKMERISYSSSRGLCAKHVRIGFMESGLFPSHPGIAYAKNYKPYFEENEWTNLLEREKFRNNMFEAPSGCVAVFGAIDPKNDRNGHIGHIEARIDRNSKNGFISDYYSERPISGFKCARLGETKRRLKVFSARRGSPFYGSRERVRKYIEVTECLEYSEEASLESNAWTNRKAVGFYCDL